MAEATAAFAKAVAQDPKNLEAMQMEGVSLFRRGKSAEAVPLLEQAHRSVANANVDPNLQGYTLGMLVEESRITEVTVFGMLQSNLNSLDFSLLLPDVTAIADEVDGQLTQSMDGCMELVKASAADLEGKATTHS
jgi:hypothetical protein